MSEPTAKSRVYRFSASYTLPGHGIVQQELCLALPEKLKRFEQVLLQGGFLLHSIQTWQRYSLTDLKGIHPQVSSAA
jgi:hypothetical protein